MQRSGAATRRFYAAFYQWTVHGRSANPTRRCTGANIVPRRGQSTRTQTYTPAESTQSTSRGNPGYAKEFVGTAELLRNERIESTVERPIGSLDAWSHAVREKTKDRVTIEISVPTWVLRAKDVAKRAEVHEVRVGVPEHQNGSRDNDLCPVLLSGDYSDVKAVWKSIYFTGSDAQASELAKVEALAPAEGARAGSGTRSIEQAMAKTLTSTEPATTPPAKIKRIVKLPESAWRPLAEHNARRYFKRKFNVQVNVLEDRGGQLDFTLDGTEHQVNRVSDIFREIPAWSHEEAQKMYNEMRYVATKGTTRTIVSQSEIPSSEMQLWQAVIRRYYNDEVHEEFCLPESIWQRAADCGVVEYFGKRSWAHLEPSELHNRGEKRSVYLKGDEDQVDRAKGFLHSLNTPDPTSSATSLEGILQKMVQTVRSGPVPKTPAKKSVSQQLEPLRPGPLLSPTVKETGLQQLELWHTRIIRKYDGDKIERELCIPESTWQRISEGGIIEYLRVRYSVQLEPSRLHEGVKRLLHLQGDKSSMNRAHAFLGNLKDDHSSRVVFGSLHKFAQNKYSDAARPVPLHTSPRGEPQSRPTSGHQEKQATQELCLPQAVWYTLSINAAAKFYRRCHRVEVTALEENDGGRNLRLEGPVGGVRDVAQDLAQTSTLPQAQFQQRIAFMRSMATRGGDVISREELHSDQLGLWEGVVRESSNGQNELEFCLPQSIWQTALQNDIVELFRRRFSVGLEQSGLYGNGERRCVRVHGHEDETSKARHFLINFKLRRNTSEDDVARSMQYAFEKYHASQATEPTTTESPQKEESTEKNHTNVSSSLPYDIMPGISRSREAVPTEPHTVVPHQQTDRDRKARSDLTVHFDRYSVPEHLRQELESSDTRSIKHIKDHSGLEEMRYRTMYGSKHFLQLVGTDASRVRAKALLQESIDRHQHDTGVVSPNMDELFIPLEAFRRAEPTHFVRIAASGDPNGLRRVMRHLGKKLRVQSGCSSFRLPDGAYDLQGTADDIRTGVAEVRNAYRVGYMRKEKAAQAIEVLLEGLIQDRPGDAALDNVPASTTPQATVVGHQAASRPVAEQPNDPIDGLEEQALVEAEAAAVEVQAAIDAAKAERQPVQQAQQPSNQQPDKHISPQLGDDMRSALRHLTQPVALLVSTGFKEAGQPSEHALRGVTVSSFCTVALSPVPIVSFNLRVPSRSWDAISTTNRLRAYLLRASPEGAAAAHTFTLPYEQPHEPFEHLRQMGAHVFVSHRSRFAPPRITWNNATTAAITMRVLPEKCIHVGDHVVVLAEVEQVDRYEDDGHSGAGALAYGMKGYRRLGDEIKPMEHVVAATSPAEIASTELKPAEPTPAEEDHTDISAIEEAQPEESAIEEVAESDNVVDLFERFAAGDEDEPEVPVAQASSEAADSTSQPAVSKDISDLGPSSPLLDEESLKQVLEESERSYASEGLPSQTAARHPALEEALNAVAGAYKDSPDTTASSQPAPTSQDSASPTDQTSNEPQKAGRTDRSPSAGSGAWGLNGTSNPLNRSLSTWARMPFRQYSTSNSPSQPPISQKILKTTVSDYLCQPPTHRKRYPDLIKTQRNAERLEKMLDSGSYVTPQEAEDLEDEILTARRKVAKELATRNAQDLEAMLDMGRVNMARAQWLESNLEAGQAVLLTEAKLLRTALRDGQIWPNEFDTIKAKLTADYEMINTQLMRLRDLVDEDDIEEEELEEPDAQDVRQEKRSTDDVKGRV